MPVGFYGFKARLKKNHRLRYGLGALLIATILLIIFLSLWFSLNDWYAFD